jgi:hypothetical protein
MQAGQFVQGHRRTSGIKVGCIEEIAWSKVLLVSRIKKWLNP